MVYRAEAIQDDMDGLCMGGGMGSGEELFFLTLISGIENSQQGKTSRTLGTGRKPQLPGTEQSLAVVLCSTLQEKGGGRDRGECLEAVVGDKEVGYPWS